MRRRQNDLAGRCREAAGHAAGYWRPSVGAFGHDVRVFGREFVLLGTVVHLDRVQGFGVAFTESDSKTALAAVLETL